MNFVAPANRFSLQLLGGSAWCLVASLYLGCGFDSTPQAQPMSSAGTPASSAGTTTTTAGTPRDGWDRYWRSVGWFFEHAARR